MRVPRRSELLLPSNRWCGPACAYERLIFGSKQTDLGDYPPEKIAFHMRTPTWCRRQALGIGPACVAVIDELLAENALFRLRAAQGVLGLADRHDPARLEAACTKAAAAGDPSYRRTITGILAAGTEHTPTTAPAATPAPRPHLHGPTQLFADPIPDPGISPGIHDRGIPGRGISDIGATVIPLPITAATDDTDPATTTHDAPADTAPARGAATTLTSSEDAS